jgi:hypothetical protein
MDPWFNRSPAGLRRQRESLVVEYRELVHRFTPLLRRAPLSEVMLRNASQSKLVAASSFGKCPRVLMISHN